MIPFPYMPGRVGQFNFLSGLGQGVGVYYASETLFNTDTFLEAAVFYADSGTTPGKPGPILIVNEQGTIMDSIPNVYQPTSSMFNVQEDTAGAFHAYVSTMTGPEVYDLPGTLPCEGCVFHPLGTVMVEHKKTLLSQPEPNPSRDAVKITFTLPEGTQFALLKVYNTNGQLLQSMKVDNRFGFVLLDNSQLPSGVYYYNIETDNGVASTRKFVVLR